MCVTADRATCQAMPDMSRAAWGPGRLSQGDWVRWSTLTTSPTGWSHPCSATVMSSLGCFLGLRCTTRARASHGAAAGPGGCCWPRCPIATTGIWVMHFVAMLGFTIPGQTITYNVPVTIASHADRRGGGGHRAAHRRLRQCGLAQPAARRGDHRDRRGQHALHRHGRDADAGYGPLRQRAGRSLGGDRGGGRDGRAVGRAPAAPPCGLPSSRR